MFIDTLRRLLLFIVLCLVQAIALSRIQLFGCAMPLLFVYFTVTSPRGYPRWATMLWSFALGLSIDMFANTPGVTAGAMTLVGFLQPWLIELFLPRDAEDHIKASAKSLGWRNFGWLAFLLTLIFCTAYFSLEAFGFFNWLYWLECIGGSTLLTFAMLMAFESLRK